jgi:hypothetical protein
MEIGETQELLHAFKWTRDIKLEDVDFELDAKTIVMKFHSKNDIS